jgi:hypothetical protein
VCEPCESTACSRGEEEGDDTAPEPEVVLNFAEALTKVKSFCLCAQQQ